MNKFDQLPNQFTYAEREAHEDWLKLILTQTEIKGKRVADIGCGGGIYTRLLATEHPTTLLGIDGSVRMLEAAKTVSGDVPIQFKQLDCEKLSDIESSSLDVIVERALIHHLHQLQLNFSEVARVLTNRESTFIVQDRTPEDCLLEGSPTHIRGYFFECFPFLAEKEKERRFSDQAVREALTEAGFSQVSMLPFWETRAIYQSKQELREDLQSRRGRTILHELTDVQLEELIKYIDERIPNGEKIIERDRWSVWFARGGSKDMSEEKKVVIGAGGYNNNPGWIHTEQSELDLLVGESWSAQFKEESLAAVLAEHIWEHLTYEEGKRAAAFVFQYLKPGGHIRVAVPDGLFRNDEYQRNVQVGGPGPKDHPAFDHKVVYTYKSLRDVFEDAGFSVRYLEYHDEQGRFHCVPWHEEDGIIFRSNQVDPRNQGETPLFPSIIIDAIKG